MKKHHNDAHEEHTDESWLIPYADILTLLLALFIILFAMSSLDQEKFKALQQALAVAFNTELPQSAEEMNIPDDFTWPFPSSNPENKDPNAGDDAEKGGALGNLYSSLDEYIHANALENTVAVEYNGENVLITLKNDIWFDSGSAFVTKDMQEKAQMLTMLVQENQDNTRPFDVIVTGHTDNVPIRTAQFPSNWYLSMQRATNFLTVMLAESDLDPSHFSTRGYGELHPIASNETAEGKQQNRRVELLISQPKEQDLPDK